MKKYLMLLWIAVTIIGILIIFKQQSTSLNMFCEKYEKITNKVCEKVIFIDMQNQIAFLKDENENIIFIRSDENGEIEIPLTSLSLTNLESEPVYWVGSNNQEKSFIIGLAIKDIKKIKMTRPVVYYPNILHLNSYSIFYIPLAEQNHMYQVDFQGFNEEDELIYGDFTVE